MSFHGDDWKPYVTVAQRRLQAERQVARLRKKGRAIAPVAAQERGALTGTFWGKSWCDNLERYSDHANRLPRGRGYLRGGAVVDLQIGPGRVDALVQGSELYDVALDVDPIVPPRWQALCADCAGSIDSLVGLLQGRLSPAVMERGCRPDTGLFPAPDEIEMACSCPDGATMCKHVAAVLYGIGVRLDTRPELLFTLRGVDAAALIAGAAHGRSLAAAAPAGGNVLEGGDLAALFGLDIAPEAAPAAAPDPVHRPAVKAAAKASGKPPPSGPAVPRAIAAAKTSVPASPAPAGKAVPAKKAAPVRKAAPGR